MNKLLRRIVVIALATAVSLGGALPARAQAQDDQCFSGVVFGFFNGVLTTDTEAEINLQELRRQYGTTSKSTGELIIYQKFYNPTNGSEDFVETFEQRLKQQEGVLINRLELFFEVMRGSGPWWSALIDKGVVFAVILDDILQYRQAELVKIFTTLLRGTPQTQIVYQDHRKLIDKFLAAGQKLVFFAHSQGNLFVVEAAKYARTQSSTNSVKVIHVAPASPILLGSHILADGDLVINSLRAFGSVPDITDQIPESKLRPPGIGGGFDPFGHGLLEIYINPALKISEHVRIVTELALEQVQEPPQRIALGGGFSEATIDDSSAILKCYYDSSRSKLKFVEWVYFDSTKKINLYRIDTYPAEHAEAKYLTIRFVNGKIGEVAGLQLDSFVNSLAVGYLGENKGSFFSRIEGSRPILPGRIFGEFIECGTQGLGDRNIRYEWLSDAFGEPIYFDTTLHRGLNERDVPRYECPTTMDVLSIMSIEYTRYPLFMRYSK